MASFVFCGQAILTVLQRAYSLDHCFVTMQPLNGVRDGMFDHPTIIDHALWSVNAYAGVFSSCQRYIERFRLSSVGTKKYPSNHSRGVTSRLRLEQN